VHTRSTASGENCKILSFAANQCAIDSDIKYFFTQDKTPTGKTCAMAKHLVRLALILILVSLACNLPVRALEEQPAPIAVAQIFVTAGPDATATPTPFQPIGPTSTPVATATPTPTPTPEPTAEPTAQPTKIRVDPVLSGDVVNLLVLGSDFRPASGFRTDTIMLVSIHPKSASVRVVSFPRDLFVTIPGWGDERINTAFPRGGFSTMADTFAYNFGVRPKYYVMTNFSGLVGIINSIGGISVNVGQELTDKCDIYQGRGGYCTVVPGPVEMDGDMALWYIRSRYSSSDFDRMRRSQEVLSALFRKLMSMDAITRLPDMYNKFKNSVETNLSVEDIIPLLPVASEVSANPGRIRQFSIGPGHVYPYIAPSGAAVLLPNYYAIRETLNEALSP
jgi:polyisoprenyl-teichoic acid--peptidoglycan teichoic acid transferase